MSLAALGTIVLLTVVLFIALAGLGSLMLR